MVATPKQTFLSRVLGSSPRPDVQHVETQAIARREIADQLQEVIAAHGETEQSSFIGFLPLDASALEWQRRGHRARSTFWLHLGLSFAVLAAGALIMGRWGNGFTTTTLVSVGLAVMVILFYLGFRMWAAYQDAGAFDNLYHMARQPYEIGGMVILTERAFHVGFAHNSGTGHRSIERDQIGSIEIRKRRQSNFLDVIDSKGICLLSVKLGNLAQAWELKNKFDHARELEHADA